jgi:thiol-disulfide isomerase/thioredoxin
MTVFGRVHMPSLGGATAWLNSEPLDPAELRGHAVLVNFWTFTCINWLRQEPYVRAWARVYGDDGLVVIGVHAPEFSFEHEIERVRQASAERHIEYPVAVDNDYEIWNAFGNHYWPALYFVDADDIIRDRHFGEGRYEKSERVIQELLGVERELVSVEGIGVEAEADWDALRTPETYLGCGRSVRFASPGGTAFDERGDYELPESLRLRQWGLAGEWALAGEWTIGREHVALERAVWTIALRFEARDAHLVLNSEARPPIPFRVLIAGGAPGRSHGADVDEDGRGFLREGRVYQLVRQHDTVCQRTLEITFLEPGAEAYAFTFG